jgi:hypothetical protein
MIEETELSKARLSQNKVSRQQRMIYEAEDEMQSTAYRVLL